MLKTIKTESTEVFDSDTMDELSNTRLTDEIQMQNWVYVKKISIDRFKDVGILHIERERYINMYILTKTDISNLVELLKTQLESWDNQD